MAKAVRSKNDQPDIIYFDDCFTSVTLEELMGKTIYIENSGSFILDSDKEALKKIKKLEINIMPKSKFNAADCDYIVIYSGYTKSRKRHMTKEQKLAYECWKETGSPMRLDWKQVSKLV